MVAEHTYRAFFEAAGSTVAICAALVYGASPLKVLGKNSLAADLDLTPTTPESLTPLAADALGKMVLALAEHGYEAIANFTTAGTLAGGTGNRVLLVNDQERSSATVVFAQLVRPNRPPIESSAIAFQTRYAEGRRLITTARSASSLVPPNPEYDLLHAPAIRDVRVLAQVHARRVVEQGVPLANRVPPPREDVEAVLRAEHLKELQRFQSMGYYRLAPRANRYAVTIKGAYLMSWKLLWPMKAIRRRLQAGRTKRQLRALGLSELGLPIA